MYSVVLMAALTTGAGSPAWCFGSNSCHGCWSSCHGCWSSCSGCWGGCHGSYGCCGGCYGCWNSCHGYWACHGCYASYGCCGGCYGYGHGCHGCYGYSCYGSCYGCCGGVIYAPPAAPPSAKPMEQAPPPKKTTQAGSGSAQARVTINLPADATLFVDDQPMKATSATRVFRTPQLEADATYYYVLRAEVTRDGQKQSEEKRILVRAGESVRASFTELDSIATARAQAALNP
ncbi:MAG TPA: TIGR03000 domain-containing protein [Gemmataceae bacterium]|nr:TIGR03000 domain-containing protein [Gemmataceae bacterium]